MKIVITGGTGFLGRHLSTYFLSLGHEMILIKRSDLTEGADRISKLIKSTDVLINLAGSPVIKRWTASNKKEILGSRLNTTNLLVETISRLNGPERPSVFLSASAIGIYDSFKIHTETSTDYDNNFLSIVCQQWEKCLDPLLNLDVGFQFQYPDITSAIQAVMQKKQ
ncbi:MAG: NAD-dependent epimerase/dehydratase family protein [Bacteroidetes bacterium]|nr:NAD-dependent epimerase/dehydratase family protein [Bacteroidota bacterium]MCL6102318.1 NAD-dependent epimerase/dehydratase family protein [Bacteroidota bacterium]